MKKFEFSLQKVLQYKSHIQKLEQDTLRQMQMDYEKLRAKKEELVANYERCKKEYLERCKEGVLAGDVAATYAYISDLQMQMKVLDKKINRRPRKSICRLKGCWQLPRKKPLCKSCEKSVLRPMPHRKQRKTSCLSMNLYHTPRHQPKLAAINQRTT